MSIALATRGKLCVGGRTVLSFVTGGNICITGDFFPFDWGFTVLPQSVLDREVYNKEVPVPTAPAIGSDLFNKDIPMFYGDVVAGAALLVRATSVVVADKQEPDLYNKEESDLYNKKSSAANKEEADIFNK